MSKEDDALSLFGDFAQVPAKKKWLDEKIKWKRLRGLACRMIGDSSIGSQIVTELYNSMLLWTLEDLQSLSQPQSYVSQSVRHRALNWIKQRAKTVPLSGVHECIPAPELSMEQALENEEQVVLLLGMLPDKWCEPWLLHRHHGYEHAEVARILNLTIDAVKKRVRKADMHLHLLATMPPEPSKFARIREFFKRKEHHRVRL